MIDAAIRLFEEHGYDDTTVEMIADEAGVSARTFHRYFETKDGVVAEGGDRIVERAIELLPAQASVRDIVRCLAAATEEDLDAGTVQWSVRLRRETPSLRVNSPTWLARWAEAVAVALASGEGRDQPELAHRVKSATAVHCSATAADEWIFRGPGRRLSQIAEEAIGVLQQDFRPAAD